MITPYPKLVFRMHALSRMAQRGFTPAAIAASIDNCSIIEEYPEDFPYPSFLALLWLGTRPAHIVAANNDADKETVIITVYEPDPLKWHAGFMRRKL